MLNRFFILVFTLLISLFGSGCANLNQQGNNGAAGALVGAAIGAIAGDTRIAAERGALAGGLLGLMLPTNQQQGYAPQQQQMQQQCVNATVNGQPGCYAPQYLQWLQAQQQQMHQQQFAMPQQQQQFAMPQQWQQQPGQPSCPKIYRSGYGWTCQ